MRIIPRRTRLNYTVWRDFTLLDIFILTIMFVILALIIMSNLPFKVAFAIGFIGFCVVLMLKADESERTYTMLGTLCKYAVSKKKYITPKDIDKLIPFQEVYENGVINYGDYFASVLSVGGVEFGLQSEYQQNNTITAISRVLASINISTTVQIVKIDRPINFDDMASNINDQINKAEKCLPRDEALIDILKTKLMQIDGLNNLQPQRQPCYYIVVYEDTKETLQPQVDAIQSAFIQCELPCSQLDDTQTAVFLKYCFSRNFDERDVWDFTGKITEYVKPKGVKFGMNAVIVDDTYSFTYAISDYPLTVGNAWGANLFNIDNTKVVLTIKPIEKQKGIRQIDRAITELLSRTKTKASEYIDNETHFETMQHLLQALQNDNEILFNTTLTITGFNTTEKKNSAFKKEIRRQIQSEGFRVNQLIGRQFEGYVSSAISRRTALKNLERGINSETLSAVFPFVFTTTLEPNGFLLGHGDYPVILDPWKRSDFYKNSNVITCGTSGSGKSYFTKTMLCHLYAQNNVNLYVLDPENEYSELCKNFKGKMIDVGNAEQGKINPFHIYPILTDDGDFASSKAIFDSHLVFLEKFFSVTLPNIQQDSLEELNNLVIKLYQDCGIDDSTDCSSFEPNKFPTFDKLLKLIRSELASEQKSAIRYNNLTRIETYITKFASQGRYSQLWNGYSTLVSDEKFVVFNFQSLFESKNMVVANAQILLVFRWLEQRIINNREKNRNGENIKSAILVDEGHLFVDPKYPVALDFMYLQAKRIRKYDGMFYFATQNLADLMGNEETKQKTTAIFNNCQYAFYFALAPADIDMLSAIYESSGGINGVERNAIVTARRGDCFAVLSSKQRAIFKIVTPHKIARYFMDKQALDKLYDEIQNNSNSVVEDVEPTDTTDIEDNIEE